MSVEMFNLPYFLFMSACFALTFLIYLFLRKRSPKTINAVLFILLFLNFALHFLKLTFPPYSNEPSKAARDIWFINICAVSVGTFPIFYLLKNKTLKDFMFYLGTMSGFVAIVYPNEVLGDPMSIDVWRFYVCHFIIFTAPLLMVVLKVHQLDYHRIWKMPLAMGAVLLFIMVQQVIQTELGIVAMRSGDFFNNNLHNPSLIWGPNDDEVATIPKMFTPKVFTTVPFGPYKGQTKYWPFFWLMPTIIIFFISIPFLLALPWEWNHLKNDCGSAIRFLRSK